MKFDQKLKISSKKNFIVNQLYNDKYLKAEIKSYHKKINTNFHNDKIPKVGSSFICL